MKLHSQNKTSWFLPVKTITVLVLILSAAGIATTGFRGKEFTSGKSDAHSTNKDSIESVKAFGEVYKVLMSPRCMNCHPSGDVPLQGDDSHLHTMAPKRGTDGKGMYAMKCSNCHQPANIEGLHTPPGNPNWHLPTAAIKMVFQGRTANQLAKQIMDPKSNGNKTKQQLLEHANDGLVMAGWNPGEGRTLPPLSHAAFKKAWITWLEKGAYAPKQ